MRKSSVFVVFFDLVCEQVEEILKTKFHIQHCNLQPEYNRTDSKEIIIQD